MRKKAAGAFRFFLAGQSILSLGESIRFIAVITLIYKITGSGISAATGVALSALPGIIASPFAGVLGDRINESRVIILIDLARFIMTPLILYAGNTEQLYLLLVIISVLDVFCGPSRRKFVLGMTGREGALKANSQLAGVSGAAYIAGPLLAGFLIDGSGHAFVIITASICCLVSGLMTLVSVASGGHGMQTPAPRVYKSGMTDFRDALLYCGATPVIRELLLIDMVIGFCVISINLSFYPYAFDVLRVTAKGWSFLITVYYGTSLSAMALVNYAGKRLKNNEGKLFYLSLGMVAAAWMLYAFIKNYTAVLALQFTEGTLIALCGIILAARLQAAVDKRYMARVSSMNDIITSAGKLAGMGCTAIITGRFSFNEVFILNGLILMAFAFAGLRRTHKLA
jgi:DHA3 family macrolide efflux protein-like MFS transporter